LTTSPPPHAGASRRRTVVVIGAGAVGIAAASWLLRDGHAVTVLDPGEVGGGSSFGNAGCLNASSVVPMSMPGMLTQVPGWLLDPLGPLALRWRYLPRIAPWLVRFIAAGRPDRVAGQARALTALLEDSFGSYLPLVEAAGARDLIRRDGHLVVYRSEEKLAGDRLGWQLRRECGVPVERLDGDAVREFDPALSPDFRIGLLMRGNGHTVNPQRLVQTLAAAFQRDGGRIVRAAAAGFAFDGGRLVGVRTGAAMVAADAAVVAAGAFSKPLAQGLGDRIPLDTERGYHVVVRDPEATPRVPVMDAEAKIVATPMEMGLRIAGTVEFAGLTAPPDWRRARKLLTLGRRLFPKLAEAPVEERLSQWMGFRPSMPDSLPVIGPSRRTRDVVYAFGHGHVGIAAAARTGRLVADLISGRPPHIDAAPFRADRF